MQALGLTDLVQNMSTAFNPQDSAHVANIFEHMAQGRSGTDPSWTKFWNEFEQGVNQDHGHQGFIEVQNAINQWNAKKRMAEKYSDAAVSLEQNQTDKNLGDTRADIIDQQLAQAEFALAQARTAESILQKGFKIGQYNQTMGSLIDYRNQLWSSAQIDENKINDIPVAEAEFEKQKARWKAQLRQAREAEATALA